MLLDLKALRPACGSIINNDEDGSDIEKKRNATTTPQQQQQQQQQQNRRKTKKQNKKQKTNKRESLKQQQRQYSLTVVTTTTTNYVYTMSKNASNSVTGFNVVHNTSDVLGSNPGIVHAYSEPAFERFVPSLNSSLY